jgi:hypothetical protein
MADGHLAKSFLAPGAHGVTAGEVQRNITGDLDEDRAQQAPTLRIGSQYGYGLLSPTGRNLAATVGGTVIDSIIQVCHSGRSPGLGTKRAPRGV